MFLIDVAIPSDYNVWHKSTKKLNKVCGTADRVPENVGRIPGQHNINSLQRSAILGTAHALRKVLSITPGWGQAV